MKRFVRQFGRSQLLGVLGDREFIGQDGWHWLTDEQIPYLIRMKDNQKITPVSGKTVSVQSRFADLRVGQPRCLRQARWIKGQRVGLSGLRLESGEWLILASNQRFRKPFEVYALRWEIETLFQCLKGRGVRGGCGLKLMLMM